MPGGNLTFAVGGNADATGTISLKIQAGSYAPPHAWCKVNCIVDASGSPSCQIIADTVTLDQAGGPQPQLGPAVFQAQQVVTVLVTGATPLSLVVVHVSGGWDTELNNLAAIATLSGGTIGAQQIIGTPFLEAAPVAVAPSATYTSAAKYGSPSGVCRCWPLA